MKKLLIFLVLVFLLSCGSKDKLTGGKKDLEQLSLVTSFPEEFEEIEDEVVFEFSKPLLKKSAKSSVYIYPPILDKEIIIHENQLKIIFNEPLQEETNYYFSLSKDIKGHHGNRLSKKEIFIFSSGNLQKNSLRGSFIFEKPQDAVNEISIDVFSSDSLFIFSKKITGKSYELNYLMNELHPIKFYIDSNNNNKYDFDTEAGEDLIAEPKQEIRDINLVYRDTIKAKINKIKALNSSNVEIEFTEKIKDFENLKVNIDSFSTQKIKYSDLNDNKLTINLSEMDSINYLFKVENLTDINNNLTEIDTLSFKGSTVQDTISPEILEVYPKNGKVIRTLKPKIKILFSEIMLDTLVKIKLVSKEDFEIVNLECLNEAGKTLIYQPKIPLKNYTSYEVIVSDKTKDLKGNNLKNKLRLEFISIKN